MLAWVGRRQASRAGNMDLGGVDVTAANDTTVRCIEDECTIDCVEVAEWEELWFGGHQFSFRGGGHTVWMSQRCRGMCDRPRCMIMVVGAHLHCFSSFLI